MIRWLVKRYLKKLLEDVQFQIQSLEMELGYNDDISREDEEKMKDLLFNKYYKDEVHLNYVINKVLGDE